MAENLASIEKKVIAYLENSEPELFELTSMLVQIDSQNFGGTGREQACARFVETLYRKAGLETEYYCPDSVPGVTESELYQPDQQTDVRPNVTGIRFGENRAECVMLAAHTDTLPAGDVSAWTRSPFSGAIEGGRVHGLGACDDKFGIAAAFCALKALDDLGVRLKKSVALTAYCDEEFGGGNGALAACVKYPCEAYVNLDGGNYEMWASALGGGGFELKLRHNRSSDDFMPVYRALNAVMQELDRFGALRRAELSARPLYKGTLTAKSAFRVAEVGCVGDTHSDALIRFMVYSTKSKAEIKAELAGILETVQPLLDELEITTEGFTHFTRYFDYSETDMSHPAAARMLECASEAAGFPVEIKGSCLTDLSVFKGARPEACCFNFGILRDFSLPCGAHQPNEYVDCAELSNLTRALALFLIRYCGVVDAN